MIHITFKLPPFIFWLEAQPDFLSQAEFTIKYETLVASFVILHISAPESFKTLPNNHKFSKTKYKSSCTQPLGAEERILCVLAYLIILFWAR